MIVDFHRCKSKARYRLQEIFFPCKNPHVGKCRENAGRKNEYLVANLFWDIIPTVRVGVEYLHGRLTHQSGADGNANRIQAQVQYNF